MIPMVKKWSETAVDGQSGEIVFDIGLPARAEIEVEQDGDRVIVRWDAGEMEAER
jgi:hypothetical protein